MIWKSDAKRCTMTGRRTTTSTATALLASCIAIISDALHFILGRQEQEATSRSFTTTDHIDKVVM